MSEQENRRPDRFNSDRPGWKKNDSGENPRPRSGQGRDDRGPVRGRSDDRGPAQGRSDNRGPARGRSDDSDRGSKPRPEWQTRVERVSPEDRDKSPMIPEEITDKDLDLLVRVQMKTLSPENAERVARHLAMVNLLIDADPELAHKHAMAAADRAGRIGVVRETVGLTAYTVGDFALALRELQAYRRISGKDDQLPVMVDCERGLGRPEKALELGRSVARDSLEVGVRVNLAIAMSGARLDRNENDLALAELEIPELNPARVFEYSPHLFRAYADTLDILGRAADSKKWFDLADRADAALGAKNAPAVEAQDIIEELVIPEPYEPRASRGERSSGNFGDRPSRDFSDRPRRDDSDRPRRDESDRPRREGADGLDSTGAAHVLRFGNERPKGERSDRPERPRTDRPRGNEAERPRRDQGERPGWKRPSDS